MSGGGGADPFHEEEEHENHERYLLTYADMITLLMALFIILYALGQTDQAKYDSFREGLSEEFGAPPVLTGGTGIVSGPEDLAMVEEETEEGNDSADDPVVDDSADVGTLVTIDEEGELAGQIRHDLDVGGVRDIDVHAEDHGVVVTLPADGVLFDSGSSQLLPAGREAVAVVIRILEPLTNAVVVEGHTDNVPMAPPFTNWELSTNRAAAVVRLMIDLGVNPDRLRAAGYADTHPVEPNATEAGRAANRRVEIVLLVTPSAEPAETSIVPDLSEPVFDPPTSSGGH